VAQYDRGRHGQALCLHCCPDERLKRVRVVMLPEIDMIREVAVSRSVCPISLKELRSKPHQVGALVKGGRRVESALYHKCSVQDSALTLGASPVTRRRVDGFELMPPMIEFDNFVRFLDWDGDGWLSTTEVATALAAILPVEEDNVERFIRDRFDVDREGNISEREMIDQVLPYLGEHLGEVLRAAPVAEVPELVRGAGREQLLLWFDHWDTDHRGELEYSDLRFAVTRVLFESLGDTIDTSTKETVTSLFLTEMGLYGEGLMSREKFVETLAPSLQANLPDAHVQVVDEPDEGPWILALHSPVTGQQFKIKVPADATVSSLRSVAADTFPNSGALVLYLDGRLLKDSTPLSSVRGLRKGVVQAVPEQPEHTCFIA